MKEYLEGRPYALPTETISDLARKAEENPYEIINISIFISPQYLEYLDYIDFGRFLNNENTAVRVWSVFQDEYIFVEFEVAGR